MRGSLAVRAIASALMGMGTAHAQNAPSSTDSDSLLIACQCGRRSHAVLRPDSRSAHLWSARVGARTQRTSTSRRPSVKRATAPGSSRAQAAARASSGLAKSVRPSSVRGQTGRKQGSTEGPADDPKSGAKRTATCTTTQPCTSRRRSPAPDGAARAPRRARPARSRPGRCPCARRRRAASPPTRGGRAAPCAPRCRRRPPPS